MWVKVAGQFHPTSNSSGKRQKLRGYEDFALLQQIFSESTLSHEGELNMHMTFKRQDQLTSNGVEGQVVREVKKFASGPIIFNKLGL